MKTMKGNHPFDRKKLIAAATPAEREAARQAYSVYAARNYAIGVAPISFDSYLAEWLDCRKVRLPAGDEPGRHEPKRDYALHYRSGEK